MAPRRRRQTRNNIGVEAPPPATSEIGTLAEQAILHSLGEMTNIFKDWASSQGRDQGNVQKGIGKKTEARPEFSTQCQRWKRNT